MSLKKFLSLFIIILLFVVLIVGGVSYYFLSPNSNRNKVYLKQEDVPECQEMVDIYSGEVPGLIPYKGLEYRNLDFYEIYQVTDGDSLWKIAEEKYNNGFTWQEIARTNNLINSRVIEIGQELYFLKKNELKINSELCEEDFHYRDEVIDGYTFMARKGDVFDFWANESVDHLGSYIHTQLYDDKRLIKSMDTRISEWEVPVTGRYFYVVKGHDNFSKSETKKFDGWTPWRKTVQNSIYDSSRYGKYPLVITVFGNKNILFK